MMGKVSLPIAALGLVLLQVPFYGSRADCNKSYAALKGASAAQDAPLAAKAGVLTHREDRAQLLNDFLDQSKWALFETQEKLSISPLVMRALTDLIGSKEGFAALKDSLKLRAAFNSFVERAPRLEVENERKISMLLQHGENLTVEQRKEAQGLILLREWFGFLHRPLNLFLIGDESRGNFLYYKQGMRSLYTEYGIRMEDAINPIVVKIG